MLTSECAPRSLWGPGTSPGRSARATLAAHPSTLVKYSTAVIFLQQDVVLASSDSSFREHINRLHPMQFRGALYGEWIDSGLTACGLPTTGCGLAGSGKAPIPASACSSPAFFQGCTMREVR